MRKYLLSAAVISGTVLAAVGSPAWAADVAALLGPSASCGTQGVCLVPDNNWTFGFSSTYDAATDTATGSGAFAANTDANGTSAIYFIDPSTGAVSEILRTVVEHRIAVLLAWTQVHQPAGEVAQYLRWMP